MVFYGKFEESKHRRAGKGSATGGQFVTKGGRGIAPAARTQPIAEPKGKLTRQERLDLNVWLAGTGESEHANRERYKELRTGDDLTPILAKFPSQPGTIYRGVDKTTVPNFDKLKPGAVLNLDYSSCTLDPKFATGVAQQQRPWDAVVLAIDQQSGRRIPASYAQAHEATGFSDQKEVVVRGRFKVTDIKREKISPDSDYELTTISVEEVAEDEQFYRADVKADIRPDQPMPSQATSFPVKAFAKPDADVEVLINPTVSQVIKFTKETDRGVRAMRDAVGNVYVWDAQAGLHGNLVDAIEKSIGGKPIFTDEFKDKDEWVLQGSKIFSFGQLEEGRPLEWLKKGQENAKAAGERKLEKTTTAAKREDEPLQFSAWKKQFAPIAQKIAKREGFTGKIAFQEAYKSGNQTRSGVYGVHNPQKKQITFFGSMSELTDKAQRGVAAHEIQHAKWVAATGPDSAFAMAQLTRLLDNPKAKHPLDDYLRPEGKHFGQLAKTGDQVSEYSKSFWDHAGRDEFRIQISMNETLAEVANRREQGTEKGIPKIWNDLYDLMDRTYKKEKKK